MLVPVPGALCRRLCIIFPPDISRKLTFVNSDVCAGAPCWCFYLVPVLVLMLVLMPSAEAWYLCLAPILSAGAGAGAGTGADASACV